MRVSILLMLGGLILGAAGCSSGHDGAVERASEFGPPASPRVELTSALLFDRRPGRYRASDFACRSDWPSSDSMYSPGQVIHFKERFVDYQGRGLEETSHTYRRFDTYRVGVGYR